jgi:hypothetical protein
MPAHVWLHGEAFSLHLLAKCAKVRDRIDTRIMPIVSLQTAHLHHQHFSTAHLHAVYHMRNLHTVARASESGTDPFSVPTSSTN